MKKSLTFLDILVFVHNFPVSSLREDMIMLIIEARQTLTVDDIVIMMTPIVEKAALTLLKGKGPGNQQEDEDEDNNIIELKLVYGSFSMN